MAENIWSVDKDDKYGYKSLMMRLCSPDRFPEPDKVEIALELQGYLNKTEWNDIYDLSKIRKRAKDKLGVEVDVAELHSHLMEVFSPEKYKRGGCSDEQLEQYNEICKTLTGAKDDINRLESELYDIAKLDVDLWVGSEVDQPLPQEEVASEEIVVGDGLLERDVEMQNDKIELINKILISLANSVAAKELADDDKLIGEVFNAEDNIENANDENCPVESKKEIEPKTEIIAEVKTKPEPKLNPKPNPKPVKPPVPHNLVPKEQGMFSHPFSFNGRIRRAEYWLSLIFAAILIFIFNLLYEASAVLGVLGYVAILWFLLAQRTKRCHDIGASGWCQLIPLEELWLLFENSEYGENEYGDCPKKMR